MYKLLLCTRYLRTRYIALASIISVMLGVATMIVVNSVMAGFSSEMRERIHGILADMVLEAGSMNGNEDPEWQMRKIQEVAGPYIEAMSPTVEVYGLLTLRYGGQYMPRPVTLVGIDPVTKAKVGTLVEHLENYKPALDENGRVARPAEFSRDEPPGWNLPRTYMEYRRLRAQEQKAMPDDDEDDAGRNDEKAPADPSDLLKQLNDLAEENHDEVLGALMKARLYVGSQIISFPFPGKNGEKPRTVWMCQPGDDVMISTVSAGKSPEARNFHATIVDVFKSGMSEYDSNLVFMNLEELQRIRGMIDPPDDPEHGVRSVTSIQIKLKNFADAKLVADRLQAAFPPGFYQIRTWEQKQGPLLAAVDVESTILNVLLFMIIAVAGFGILAIFFMIVVEKTRDIGILKSLGASSRGVMSIFVSYGLSLGMVGSGVGVVVGLLFVRYINEIERGLTVITGRKVFDETIYYFPSIPTRVDAFTVTWVAAGAVAIAIMASILPARRAARLHPVQALRHE
ncbi:MAG: ABC transporter permease [Planctomycetia bacterium]|nr:ABC transporter permease [Planctomycetia bacterium]